MSMENCRVLDLNLASIAMKCQLKTLFVVAPYDGNGATTSTLSLARALREHLGESVLVIDGNPKAPIIHTIFNIPLSPGFRSLVDDRARPNECIHKKQTLSFDVMAAGEVKAARPIHELRDRTRTILESLANDYRYILFDSMAIQANPEVLVMAPVFDGVVLVLESEMTPWSIGEATKDKLERSGANLTGAILNKRKLYIPKWIYDRW